MQYGYFILQIFQYWVKYWFVILSFQVRAKMTMGKHANSHLHITTTTAARNITNVQKITATLHHGAGILVAVTTLVTTVRVSIKTSMKLVRSMDH